MFTFQFLNHKIYSYTKKAIWHWAIWQKDILTLDGLKKGQLIQLDDVTRIKLVLRNQG